MKYSIIVPCYNEEGNIKQLIKAFAPVSKKIGAADFELILVNNGSADHTQQLIEEGMRKYAWIKTVYVKVNKGYGYGVLQGLKAGRGEYLGWIHADLQIRPKAVLDEINWLELAGSKNKTRIFLKGRRRNRPVLDRLFTAGMGCFESLYLGTGMWDIYAQPTLMHRSLFDQYSQPPYDLAIDLYYYYLAKKKNYQIGRVPVIQHPRKEGKSSWNTGMISRFKLIKRTIISSVEMKKRLRKDH